MPVHPFDLFCHELGYVERWREAQREEESLRAEAFANVARPVAGVPLRPLTPRDLLILDGFSSPFVCGDPSTARADHIVSVLWMLRASYPSGLLGRLFGFRAHRRMLRRRWRVAGQLERDHAALVLWFDCVFHDSGAPRGPEHPQAGIRAPVGANFVASLLVPICCEMGAVDPATGQPLIDSPLASLFQYQKILRYRREGEKFVDFSGSDRVKAEAQRDWNALSTEARALWTERAKTYEPAAA